MNYTQLSCSFTRRSASTNCPVSVKNDQVNSDFTGQHVNVLDVDLEVGIGIFGEQGEAGWPTADLEFYVHLIEQVPIHGKQVKDGSYKSSVVEVLIQFDLSNNPLLRPAGSDTPGESLSSIPGFVSERSVHPGGNSAACKYRPCKGCNCC